MTWRRGVRSLMLRWWTPTTARHPDWWAPAAVTILQCLVFVLSLWTRQWVCVVVLWCVSEGVGLCCCALVCCLRSRVCYWWVTASGPAASTRPSTSSVQRPAVVRGCGEVCSVCCHWCCWSQCSRLPLSSLSPPSLPLSPALFSQSPPLPSGGRHM